MTCTFECYSPAVEKHLSMVEWDFFLDGVAFIVDDDNRDKLRLVEMRSMLQVRRQIPILQMHLLTVKTHLLTAICI